MRLIAHLPPAMTLAYAQQLAQAVGKLSGGRVELCLEDGTARTVPPPSGGWLSDPKGLTVDERSRFYAVNLLGASVAVLGPLESSMLMVLIECGSVVRGSKTLHAALLQFPAWKGQAGQVRAVYANLRKKLLKTHYPLVDGRGQYGFRVYVDGQERQIGLEVVAGRG